MTIYAFVVTSAINTSFGVFKVEKRYQQTLQTLQSIKDAVPNARIALLEGSPKALPDEMRCELQKRVQLYIDFSKHPDMLYMHNQLGGFFDFVKSMIEMAMLKRFYHNVQQHSFFNDIRRVFKISGRYYLNQYFSIDDYHEDFDGKFVFGLSKPSQFPLEKTLISAQYMSRLYSFDITLYEQMIQSLHDMLSFMFQRMEAGCYVDVEHLLYHCIPQDKIIEIDPLGVSGVLASNGVLVID